MRKNVYKKKLVINTTDTYIRLKEHTYNDDDDDDGANGMRERVHEERRKQHR